MIAGKDRPTIEAIREDLIKKGFTAVQLSPNILITTMLHHAEKYDKRMSKAAGIISRLVADQHQPIIEGKTPQEAWATLEERF